MPVTIIASTDFTDWRFLTGDIEANLAKAGFFLEAVQRIREAQGNLLRRTQKVEGQAGGRLRADSGEAGESIHQVLDRFWEGAHIICLHSQT
jgi:hypothetical protein